jgi:hypothetical protein
VIMKKLLICSILLMCSSIVSAQKEKIKYGISVFPNFSMELVNNQGEVPQDKVDRIKSNEVAKPSFSVALNASKKINDKWSLVSGLGYQNNGGRTVVREFYKIDPTIGFIYEGKGRAIFNHHSVELSLLAKRRVYKSYYVIGGGSGTFNFLNTITSKDWDEKDKVDRTVNEDKSSDFREMNVYVNFGIGREFKKGEKLQWYIHPFAQLGLLGVSHYEPLNRNILALGLTTGFFLN